MIDATRRSSIRHDLKAAVARVTLPLRHLSARPLDGGRSGGISMRNPDSDTVFSGSIPNLYQRYLVPLIFEPYAADLADRLASRSLSRVLEIAAGTGVVTRSLASALPESVSIVATDLNQSMLDMASTIGTTRPVEWRQADAMQLPFPDGTFRCRCLPVRSDVLSGQVESVCRGTSRAQALAALLFSTCGIESLKTNLPTP